jgi:CDP-6-deoxy-D-xylo-4-hexulose-3-dehydrase
VIGGSGRIGYALQGALEARGFDVVAPSRRAPVQDEFLDLLDGESIERCVDAARPDVVFFAVDGSARLEEFERDPALADCLFSRAVGRLVGYAESTGARLVLYSSDFVFDGNAGPYSEDDDPNPATALGIAKLGAEKLVLSGSGLVVRTSEVFGWNRSSPNIAMMVWRDLASSRPVQASREWRSTPTLADDLAEATVTLVEGGAVGVFHVAGRDSVSQLDLATAIAEAMSLDVDLIEDADSPIPGGRRAEGGLVTTKLMEQTGHVPLELEEAVKRFRRQWRRSLRTTRVPRPAIAEEEELREEILERVVRYHALRREARPFEPYRSRVSYSGRVYGAEELVRGVDAVLDFWLTLGPRGEEFERLMRRRFNSADFVLVNSGSTANLTAIMSLMSPHGSNPLEPGDEVITPAVTFPTTLAPIVHGGLIPVFVDCEIGRYNIDPALLEDAVSSKTRAIVVPHTLGNPCEMDAIVALAEKHELVLVEDICDALGAAYDGKPVGTFGQLATVSFYPAHHMTMGEGGGIVVNKAQLSRTVRSVRDWGRDCWCDPGESNTCGRRFDWQLGELPYGYDHKYIYSNLGYNFKPTDIQAAIGLAQLDRLDDFLERRQQNFETLFAGLSKYQDVLVLPRWSDKATPAWFGFPITVSSGVRRDDLVQWLEAANIETRQVFAGNILRQPAYRDVPSRVCGDLANSDRVMRDTFFIGVYPGLTDEMLAFVLEQFDRFFEGRRRREAVSTRRT